MFKFLLVSAFTLALVGAACADADGDPNAISFEEADDIVHEDCSVSVRGPQFRASGSIHWECPQGQVNSDENSFFCDLFNMTMGEGTFTCATDYD